MEGDPRVLEADVDSMLDRLWSVKKRHPGGQFVQFSQDEMYALCHKAREVFMEQPMLLELEAPLALCGDVHGQYHDLLRIFDSAKLPPITDYLFLGDYVDRGKKSIETVCMLFAYKVKYPENFFLLRGNHESPSVSRIYGFYDECKRRFDVKVWQSFCDVFNALPVCATIDDRVICMHGGLSQDIMVNGQEDLQKIRDLQRPADIPDAGLLCDLLWADPSPENHGWNPNDRGVSLAFGANVVAEFLNKMDMDLVCRAHQVVEDGYEFFAQRQLVTIFSAPNYCGEFDNAGAILNINEELQCSFTVLKPVA